MKMAMVGLALVALVLAWVGYRMDLEQAGLARVTAWLAGSGVVVLVVLNLLRRA